MRFRLRGKIKTITGALWHAMATMNAESNHVVMGADRTLEARLVRDSPARIWWNGEPGCGYDQRTGPWGEW